MFLFLLAVFSRPAKSMASEHRMLGLHPKVIMQIFGRVSAGFYLLLNSFIIIRFGRILPLRPTTHQYGNPYFSQWGSVVPNFKIKCVLSRVPTFASTDVHFKGRIQIYNILKFTEDKNFVNFSLVSPHENRHASREPYQFSVRIVLRDGFPVSARIRIGPVEVSVSSVIDNPTLSGRRASLVPLYDCR
jgi:hypothetical protein